MNDIKPSTLFNSFLQKRSELIKSCHQRALLRRAILKNFINIFKKYKINKAYIFGSMKNNFCLPDSDIDLFVEGLEKDDYWKIWHDLEEAVNYPVDLYCQFDDPVFIKKIKERGELIYEG